LNVTRVLSIKVDDPPLIDPLRVLSDLRELTRRTAGPEGADRLCWGSGWQTARLFLDELLSEIGLHYSVDPAGNAWTFLGPASEPALVIGSHLDAVPGGGWLDGALGVMAGVGVLRVWVSLSERPPRRIGLVDWADEEGARFGRSLFGSSAVAGTFDPNELGSALDADGKSAREILASNDVDLDRVADAKSCLGSIDSYLELHIEQGPVLDAEGLATAAVSGCVGVDRFWISFSGAASHAGTTPIVHRRDAGLAAAEAALGIERIAKESAGLATTGAVRFEPGVATVIPGQAALSVDLRHRDRSALASMVRNTVELAKSVANGRKVEVEVNPIWRIEPVQFDAALVEAAAQLCEGHEVVSGALHDAAEMARAGVSAAMMFCPSINGVSHAPTENTNEADLILAIERFGRLCSEAMTRPAQVT
jgi:N-carbamoyl-L-amino-acid hydrolase